jgi:hypothetical protein
MKVTKKDIIALLHPIFFGIFPLLFLYAQNAGEMMMQDILLPLLLSTGFAVVVTLGLGFIIKDVKKSALVATIILFVFFSSGHIARILPEIHFPSGGLRIGIGHLFLAVCLGLVITGIIQIIRTKRNLFPLTKILTTVGAFLVLFQVVQAGIIIGSRTSGVTEEVISFTSTQPVKQLPDIYYIVMDGYTGKEILKEIFDVDNTDFYTFLREKGFHVPERTYSNYCQTVYSVAATLNMCYITDLGNYDRDSRDRMPVSGKLRENAVVRFLKGAGYTIAAFSSGYLHTNLKNTDFFFNPTGAMSEFENILLTTTMFPLTQGEDNPSFAKHRRRVTYILDKITRLDEVPSPKFVFAHVISPHPPFIFTADGEPTLQSDYFHMCDGSHYMTSRGGGLENYIDGYRGQITYITKLLKVTVQKILDHDPEHPPVIIFQADHGSGSGLSWESLEKTNIKERFSILNVYYFPGYENKDLYKIESPVNTFRVVFNTYFGTRFPLLPNRHYYAQWSRPHDYKDVTEILYSDNRAK